MRQKISRQVRKRLPLNWRMKLSKRERADERRVHYLGVASRISEIWGVPVRELMPEIIHRKSKFAAGDYFHTTHEVSASAGEVMGHEMMHGFYELLGKRHAPRKLRELAEATAVVIGAYPKGLQQRMMRESIAEIAEKPETRSTHIGMRILDGVSSILTVGAASLVYPLAALILSPKIAARQVEFMMQPGAVGGLYKRHGIDGLILFMVKPPRVFGALETRLWERGVVKRGMLNKEGGFTEEGIELVKQIMPREKILEKLEDMKRARFRKDLEELKRAKLRNYE